MKKALSALGAFAALIGGAVMVSSVEAGLFNDPLQDCDPDAGNPTTGRWYQNGRPGETNNVVAGFRQEGDTYIARSRNTGTDAKGEPFNNVIQCGSDETRWELFLTHLGDRADTARVDAVGFEEPGYEPLPPRIDARLFGEEGPDTLLGHDGKNKLKGGRGPDELRSFGGKDLLVGGPARDLIVAGAGRDVVRAADGKRDEVRCGGGQDAAKVDPSDDVSGCETIRVR